MYKVAAVGDFERIAYFGAIGMETFFTDSKREAGKLIKKLGKNGYAIIFVTEEFYENGAYQNDFLPAVLPIGSGKSETGEDRLSEYVKRAIGSDMIFDG